MPSATGMEDPLYMRIRILSSLTEDLRALGGSLTAVEDAWRSNIILI